MRSRCTQPAALVGLYAITPDWQQMSDPWAQVAAVLQGGCRFLQYRDKTASRSERLQRGQRLLAECRAVGAKLIINDDVDLALSLAADGVHLGAEDGDWLAARQQMGPEAICGFTCHSDEALLHRGIAAGADYLAFGALFPSTGKRTAPVGAVADFLPLFQQTHHAGIAVCVIGGLTQARLPTVRALGADLLAMMTEVFHGSPQQIVLRVQQLVAECAAGSPVSPA